MKCTREKRTHDDNSIAVKYGTILSIQTLAVATTRGIRERNDFIFERDNFGKALELRNGRGYRVKYMVMCLTE